MYPDFISQPFFSEIYQDIIADLTQRLWTLAHAIWNKRHVNRKWLWSFLGGGGGEEVRWKTVRTYGKILATPLCNRKPRYGGWLPSWQQWIATGMKYKKREHEIPFRTFQPGKRAYLFRFSNGTNRRHVFHFLPNRDFRKLWLNGKRRPKFFISLIYKCFKASAKNSTNRTIMIITTSSPSRFMSVRWIRLI